jgi:hypothetical protein
MAALHTVGMKIDKRSYHVVIEAEDALIAALRAKHDRPDAVITYARKTNRRGDRRHPQAGAPSKRGASA